MMWTKRKLPISLRPDHAAPLLRAISITLALAVVSVLAACSGSTNSSGPVKQETGAATLSVWADAPRAAEFKGYSAPGITLNIETTPNTLKDRVQKLVLANKAKKGWPDIFEVSVRSAHAFGQPPYNYAADISSYLPSGFLDHYPEVALAPCKDGKKITCLPNEVGPYVLWYNKPVMKKFGYSVPTTWEQFQQIGSDIAKNHPGYVVGGTGSITEAYLEASRCPVQQLIQPKTVYSNLQDPKCLRAAKMVDTLLAAGSLANSSATDPTFIKKYGAAGKWVMMVAPSWYARFVFENQYKTPSGSLGIAPPLKWEGESQAWTGNNGGVYYEVSRHSAHLKQAVEVIKWMSSGPNQTSTTNVTVPAYKPAQQAWAKSMSSGGFITASNGTVLSVIQTASSQMDPDFNWIPVDGIRGQDVLLPIVQKGGTVTEGLAAYQKVIDNLAGAAGYKVVHSK